MGYVVCKSVCMLYIYLQVAAWEPRKFLVCTISMVSPSVMCSCVVLYTRLWGPDLISIGDGGTAVRN